MKYSFPVALALALLAPAALAQTKPKAASAVTAPAAPKVNALMTRDELRTCFKTQKSNEAEATSLKASQDEYARDYETLRTDKAEIDKANADNRERLAAVNAERDAISARTDELRAVAESAKTDEQRAAYEVERLKLVERNTAYEKTSADFYASQAPLRGKTEAFNAKVGPLNERSKAVNAGVEPLQQKVAQWRERCGNRRYDEADEIAVRKEMAAGK